MTGRALQDKWTSTLHELYDAREVKQIFMLWLEEVHRVQRLDWLLMMDKEVAIDDEEVLQRLLNAEPIQYIIGYSYFMDHKFKVSKDVLIPRPETEDLVNVVLEDIEVNSSILDVGTGSGCIPISLKFARPDLRIGGMDISNAALEIAKENAVSIGVDIEWYHSDVLSSGFSGDVEWDVIVSNPPYIEEKESASMHDHVVKYEPHQALFVPDEDPLLFYRRIADLSLQMKNRPSVYFECHVDHTHAVAELMRSKGWEQVRAIEDITGRPRIIASISS